MTAEEYISLHHDEDVRTLALRKMPEGIDATWVLTQIEGYQLAKRKLPQWAATPSLHYPPRLSMEQCSSQLTAQYKADLASQLTSGVPYSIADITGGFGVDFSYMAQHATDCYYIEQQPHLCQTAQHNMPLLGIPHAHIWNLPSEEAIPQLPQLDIIFADPARRDTAGRKTVAIEDCTPNIASLLPALLHKAHHVIIKLSPMLDITQALRSLPSITQVHIISVKGECKELLFVASRPTPDNTLISYHCINLNTPDSPFITTISDNTSVARFSSLHRGADSGFLFEPNASILKAGMQDAFCHRYGLSKIAPHSNLYVGPAPIPGCPARTFRILATTDFSKQHLRPFLAPIKQANLTIRNFPDSVATLRKRLKLKEGGSTYLFATTLPDGSHILIKCEKE